MTGRWIPRSKAAKRLGISLAELDALVDTKALHQEFVGGDHDAISEESVARVEAERARRPVPRDPDNPAERLMTAADEDEFQRGKEEL